MNVFGGGGKRVKTGRKLFWAAQHKGPLWGGYRREEMWVSLNVVPYWLRSS
jgi:hypothetical protein